MKRLAFGSFVLSGACGVLWLSVLLFSCCWGDRGRELGSDMQTNTHHMQTQTLNAKCSSHLCKSKVPLLLSGCVSSSLPCLVRELREPGTRTPQFMLRPVYRAVKLDFLRPPWTQTKVIILLLSSQRAGAGRDGELLCTPTPFH